MIINDIQTIEFESNQNNITLVEKFVEELCDYFNVHNDYYGNILIALTEAVNNAVVHGNKLNTNKKVQVQFQSKNGCLSFSVADQGDGFDFNNVPDPTDPANENPEAGRGIFLIKSLADEVTFSKDGRVVEMNFKIANINNTIAANRAQQLLQHQKEKKSVSEKKKI